MASSCGFAAGRARWFGRWILASIGTSLQLPWNNESININSHLFEAELLEHMEQRDRIWKDGRNAGFDGFDTFFFLWKWLVAWECPMNSRPSTQASDEPVVKFLQVKKSRKYIPPQKGVPRRLNILLSLQNPANLLSIWSISKRFCDFPAEEKVIGWNHRLATGHRGCTCDNEIMSCYYHVVVFVRKCICNTSQMIPRKTKHSWISSHLPSKASNILRCWFQWHEAMKHSYA